MPIPLSPTAQTLLDPAQREQTMTTAGVPALAARLANAMIPETGTPGSVGQWSFATRAAQAALPEGLTVFRQALARQLPDVNTQALLDWIARHPREVQVTPSTPLQTLAGKSVRGLTTAPLDPRAPLQLAFDPSHLTWPEAAGHEVAHVVQGLQGRFMEAMPGLASTPKGQALYQAMGTNPGPELFANLIDHYGLSRVSNPTLFRQALEASRP